MHNQPVQPLEEAQATIEKQRQLLNYVATCLLRTQWSGDEDLQYATSLAEYIRKQIGDEAKDEDEEYKRIQGIAEQAAMQRDDEARSRWLARDGLFLPHDPTME